MLAAAIVAFVPTLTIQLVVVAVAGAVAASVMLLRL